MSRKQELEDALDLDLVKRAATAFIREQIDAALKERLPQLLMRAGDTRRPPLAAGGATESVGPTYLTRAQASTITGYSPRSIARFIETDQLRACGPRRDRITRYELDRFMDKREDHHDGVEGKKDPDADVTAAIDAVLGIVK